jgi:hypothetical protein
MPRFVIQEHQARTHHFNFRLENDGVFKSWAVPRGLPTEVGVKRVERVVNLASEGSCQGHPNETYEATGRPFTYGSRKGSMLHCPQPLKRCGRAALAFAV